MMGGSETVSGDKDGVHTAAIHVPIGWQRRMEGEKVIYVSPSGAALSTLEEVKAYLLTDGTCKCGLECPLILNKVFNFSIDVKVEHRSQPLGKPEQDMTKLCNHRRKVVAMAALCRSMQGSQHPFANFHHPDVGQGDSRDPKQEPAERKEDDHGSFLQKLQPVSARLHNNLHPNPCASPKSPHHFIYPYNGSPSVLHTGTNSHHALDPRKLHHPTLPTSSTSSSSSSFIAHSSVPRSPCTPTPQKVSQGQRTPKTPDAPSSPRVGALSSPPPSSPIALSGGIRGAQSHTHHPHVVIVGAPPLSPSTPLSPSVHSLSASPHQRSRHLSASPSSLCGQGGGPTAPEGGELTGSNLRQRKKTTTSSPRSPVPSGSPNPSPHFPKYKLEDILEQFKNSGSNSTNNHHPLSISNPSLLTTLSSSSPHVVSSKPLKTIMLPTASAGTPGFGGNPPSSCSIPLGPLLNHHYSHQGKLPRPASFPASSLLSAAAKAQLANQITQGQGLNAVTPPGSLSSLNVLKETPQQQKVTNSTLHNSHSPCIASARLSHSLAAASAALFPPSHSLAQSLASTLPHLPPTAEQNASYRKRQRRSPTVLKMLKDTQALPNGSQRTPPEDAVVINLSSSSSSYPSPLHSSSTSALQNQSSASVDNQNQNVPGHMAKVQTSRHTAHLSRTVRPNEALDFTTSLTPSPLSLDPPTQPLSALLHLLSVQNAQTTASAANSTLAQSRTASVEGGGHTSKQSPKRSSSSPAPSVNNRLPQPQSPFRRDNTNPLPLVQQPLSSPHISPHFTSSLSVSPAQSNKSSPPQKHSPSVVLPKSNLAFQSSSSTQQMTSSPTDKQQSADNHIPTSDSVSQASSQVPSPQGAGAADSGSNSTTTSVDLSQRQGSALLTIPSSPKPLDLSNHVLAFLAASSTVTQGNSNPPNDTTNVQMSSPENQTARSEEDGFLDPKSSTLTKRSAASSPTSAVLSHHEDRHSPPTPSALSESMAALPLAEAFPFMNQDQLLQLLSSTGGLPSVLDPALLALLPLGGLWMGGQNAQTPPASVTPQPQQNFVESQPPEEQQILMQDAQQNLQDQQQKQQLNSNPLFPLLPLLSGTQGELPLNLIGLQNFMSASAPSAGQDLDLSEKNSLHALFMASLLLGQQQPSLLPLSALGQMNQVSLEVPIQHSQQIPTTLDGLALDKTSCLLEPSSLTGPGLLELTQGLLPITAGAEGPIQALHSLLLPATLPPPPAAFLPFNPALLTAALSSLELHPPPNTQLAPAQQTQHTQPQVTSEAGVETLIPVALQGKDNPILQQLLPTLLNPALLGDVSGVTGLPNMVGMEAGSILLSPVQASALGMSLLQGPDGAINLLNSIQLNLAPPSDGEKSDLLQETQSPVRQEDIPASEVAPEATPSPAPALTPSPAPESSPLPHKRSEGKPVIDPYTSFMDTIYTSFLQVSAKEQEDGGQLRPTDPTSPFCALPPVSFPVEHHFPSTTVSTFPQASSPATLSPRRACSLRNPDLSRLNLEATAHSPAQGTPKPIEDGQTSPLQRKPAMEGHVHLEPPLAPIFLEEAKTDCTASTGAVCPFVEGGSDQQGHLPHTGYLSPRDGGSERLSQDTTETVLDSGQGVDQAGGARRGRKRKQTLQNVLEDFRDMDATALEEIKAATVLLKPERSVRGRRRRGARSLRQ